MATIKIEDLPVMEDLDEKQTKGIFGGFTFTSFDYKISSDLLKYDGRKGLRRDFIYDARVGKRI